MFYKAAGVISDSHSLEVRGQKVDIFGIMTTRLRGAGCSTKDIVMAELGM